MRSTRFIAFEGPDGSGKSTQAAILAADLGAVLTREPGGTAIGAVIRRLLLDHASADLSSRAEALLVAGDRAQHVDEVVRPALGAGRHVVSDRSAGSSLAYQGFGRGLDLEQVRGLSEWASAGLWPDLVLLLVVPADLVAARLDGPLDRFEAEAEGFQRRVVDGYVALAAADPVRWAVIDGSQSVAEVGDAVRLTVGKRLGI